MTNDLTKLATAIDRVKFVPPLGYIGGIIMGRKPATQKLSGATALWDAISATVDGVKTADGSRRVIVVLTDGEDTNSSTKRRDAIAHAASRGFAVFSIGIAAEDFYSLDRDALKKLSEETGELAFFPQKVADLDGIFRETAKSLKSSYVLTYCSANDRPATSPSKLEIKIQNAQLRGSQLRLAYPHYGL